MEFQHKLISLWLFSDVSSSALLLLPAANAANLGCPPASAAAGEDSGNSSFSTSGEPRMASPVFHSHLVDGSTSSAAASDEADGDGMMRAPGEDDQHNNDDESISSMRSRTSQPPPAAACQLCTDLQHSFLIAPNSNTPFPAGADDDHPFTCEACGRFVRFSTNASLG